MNKNIKEFMNLVNLKTTIANNFFVKVLLRCVDMTSSDSLNTSITMSELTTKRTLTSEE